MKEKYISPKFEITYFVEEDILTLSAINSKDNFGNLNLLFDEEEE